MAEYIGSRISLISKRDIRYVGILHEISSENSTVALEQVKSYGTEGRTEEGVPPSDNVYEYIVFRGSDVKDLRIEKEPEKQAPAAPQVPDDPAILGNARLAGPPGQGQHQQPQGPHANQQGQPPRYPQQSPYGYGGYPPPPNQRFGPYGAPPGGPHGGPQGFPNAPYGPPPPGWYGPPGQNFRGPPGPMPPHMQQQFGGPEQGPRPGQPMPSGEKEAQAPVEKPAAAVKLPAPADPADRAKAKGPPPPTASKPDVASAMAPASAAQQSKGDRIPPAIPKVHQAPTSYAAAISAKPPGAQANSTSAAPAPKSMDDANRDARNALAAAMAKLPPISGGQGPKKDGFDNLTNKVNEMRTNDINRARGSYSDPRGARGAPRGRARGDSHAKKIEIPKTDYDFESANAKFNKQDLVKEAIASGDAAPSPVNGSSGEAPELSRRSSEQHASGPGYNKMSSFFDDISSEAKDREDGPKKAGGREFRHEEQKKNLETFGQGSVDNYRGGMRGRGRGRGFRGGRSDFRGRGGRGGAGGTRGRSNGVAADA